MTLTNETVMYGGPRGGPYTSTMAKRKIMGMQEARQNLATVVDAALKDGEQTIILRRNTPVVVIVPAEWFQRAAEVLGEPWEAEWSLPALPKPKAD